MLSFGKAGSEANPSVKIPDQGIISRAETRSQHKDL